MSDKLFVLASYCFLASVALGLLLLIGAGGCSLLGGIDKEYSSGKRIGTITKFSNKGFVFKTWEGELNLGGLRKEGDKTVANTWEFSDPSGRFEAEINRAAESGDACVIHYRQVWVRSFWASNSDYHVTGIEAAGKRIGDKSE